SRIGVPRRRPMGTLAFILEQPAQLARRPPRAPDAQKVCERPLLAENRRRVGTLAQVGPLATIEMSLRRAIDAERLFKLLPKRRKLGIGLSRQRQRSRRERGCSKARGACEQAAAGEAQRGILCRRGGVRHRWSQ